MNFHVLDILSIALILFIASIYLVKNFINIYNKKCGAICSGCSSNSSCGKKSFIEKSVVKPIHFKPKE